jgi:hypothetical protein
LCARGHDVQVVSRDYPPGLPDDDVLAIAQSEHRVLLVADYDFGELIFRDRLVAAGVAVASKIGVGQFPRDSLEQALALVAKAIARRTSSS